MPLLWLASVAHRSERSAQKKSAKRRRLTLVLDEWLQGRFTECGIKCDAAGPVQTEATRYKVVALLDIEPGTTWDGACTAWPPEAEALKRYYEHAADAYSVKVKRVFRLLEPLPLWAMVGARGLVRAATPASPVFTPAGFEPESTSHVMGHSASGGGDDGQARSVADVIAQWGYSAVDLSAAQAYACVDPIACAVAQGRWQWLVWLGRWQVQVNPLPGFPSEEWRQERSGETDVRHHAEITEGHVTALMGNLRRWLPWILAAAGEDAMTERMEVEMALTWLGRLQHHLGGAQAQRSHVRSGSAADGDRGDPRVWCSTMVASHFMASYLSNFDHIGRAASLGVEVLFPGCFTTVAMQKASYRVSTSYLRKRQVAFDAAYLLYMRREFALDKFTRWAWIDSSPQAGRDWFQCKEQYIKDADLAKVAKAVDKLILSSNGDAMGSDDLKECNSVIAACVHVHMKAPMAKGQGCSGVEHLASCFAQCNLLEAGDVATLQRYLSEYVSLTSDMGVESGIRSFKISSIKDVLPEWYHQRDAQEVHLEADIGMDGEAVAEPHPDAAAADPEPFLKYGLEVSGSLHILSNLPKDLETKLLHWQCHMEKLKVFEALLGENYHRERLRATCLRDSEMESELFKKFSANLYDKRWLAVYNFVARSHELIKVLVHKWDVVRYIEGFSRDKADAEKDRRFNPHAVAAILADPLFLAYNTFLLSVGNILKRLCSWMEACPCHISFVRALGTWRKRKVSWKSIFPNMAQPRCMLAGCRAPEIASGALEDCLRDIASMSCEEMIAAFPDNLSEQDRQAVIQDFGVARSYLELGLQLKFDCWSRLPWRLAALAHPSDAVRTSTARAVLDLFDQSARDGYQAKHHHPMTTKFLLPGCVLRAEVEALAASGVAGDNLIFEAARLKFIPIAERALPPVSLPPVLYGSFMGCLF